ncbi:MAG: HEAT repeat domain-containing protein [Fusobacterium sp.]|uniref:HEAT repeat domain-containing protein n=1 Tax=Fusobacterium sp. TaxID=68766 RepID=UPI0026DB760C|nr:HEAT repeat domain-containing protein [Fusobacterium sp.]MDO4691167.1 HEAT repeat domain-containing protein [Fusobacterium sp.]
MTKKEYVELLNEVNSYGYNFKKPNDIKKIGKKDKILIPILLKWLNKTTDFMAKSWIARCLTVEGYTEATEELLKLYKTMDSEKGDKWAVGNAIGVISDKRYIDDYIEIITDKSNGSARQMIVNYMGAFKEERVKKVLISLLDDEEVNGHAIYALSKFKDISLIEKLEPFTAHKMTWKRNEAKKAIAKLEKLKEKEGK